jgi:hypothetical protein
MIEKAEDKMISRRRAFPLLGLAAALGLALPPWLTASNAEAQTAGQEKRGERQDDRGQQREERQGDRSERRQ